MTTESAEAQRILEGLRQRLAQLAESTLKLGAVIRGGSAEAVPEAGAVLASYTVVATHQQAVTEHLARHHDVLAALNVFPLPPYPGHSHEGMLLQLLRKKPEPRVDDWLASAHDTFRAHTTTGDASAGGVGVGKNPDARMTEHDWTSLWAWAPSVVKEQAAAYRARFGDADSDDDEDEDEDGDEEMEGTKATGDGMDQDVINVDAEEVSKPSPPAEPISTSRLLKYFHTGILPPPEPKNVRPPGRPV